jgi:hypothetical protein
MGIFSFIKRLFKKTPPQVPSKPTASPPTVFPGSLEWKNVGWDVALLDAIAVNRLAEIEPSDWSSFCPQPFSSLSHVQKIYAYARILVRMAKFESKFDPECTYTEKFNDGQGNRVKSLGLFQISKESTNAYTKKHGFTVDNVDLLMPTTNIKCAVIIFATLLRRDGCISKKNTFGKWLGPSAYWAVLSTRSEYATKALESIKSANS